MAHPRAHAMKLKPQKLNELIADSQSIIAGKITRVTDGIAPNGLRAKIAAGAKFGRCEHLDD